MGVSIIHSDTHYNQVERIRHLFSLIIATGLAAKTSDLQTKLFKYELKMAFRIKKKY